MGCKNMCVESQSYSNLERGVGGLFLFATDAETRAGSAEAKAKKQQHRQGSCLPFESQELSSPELLSPGGGGSGLCIRTVSGVTCV